MRKRLKGGTGFLSRALSQPWKHRGLHPSLQHEIRVFSKTIEEFKKNHNATPLEPQLNYWELAPTKSVQGKIPRFPASEQMNSIEMRSALGRIQDMEEDGAYMAREDQIRAAQSLQSIQSGIPISHLQAASGMIEGGLPSAVRENAESIQRASQADAQRRAMADAAVTLSLIHI